MLVFVEGGKPENMENNKNGENQKKRYVTRPESNVDHIWWEASGLTV